MGKHVGLTAEDVRRAYLRNGADARATARALGVTDATIRHHLLKLTDYPLSVPTLTLDVPGMHKDDQEAIAAFVRGQLTRAGILK